jgi:hypothetical protein
VFISGVKAVGSDCSGGEKQHEIVTAHRGHLATIFGRGEYSRQANSYDQLFLATK